MSDLVTCQCMNCQDQRATSKPFPASLVRVMPLCPTCGNKRCPRATWHVQNCTGSNEPGQMGSAYQSPLYPDGNRW